MNLILRDLTSRLPEPEIVRGSSVFANATEIVVERE